MPPPFEQFVIDCNIVLMPFALVSFIPLFMVLVATQSRSYSLPETRCYIFDFHRTIVVPTMKLIPPGFFVFRFGIIPFPASFAFPGIDLRVASCTLFFLFRRVSQAADLLITPAPRFLGVNLIRFLE